MNWLGLSPTAITVSGAGEWLVKFQVLEMGSSLEGQGWCQKKKKDAQDII